MKNPDPETSCEQKKRIIREKVTHYKKAPKVDTLVFHIPLQALEILSGTGFQPDQVEKKLRRKTVF